MADGDGETLGRTSSDGAIEAPARFGLTGVLDGVDVPIMVLDRALSLAGFNQAAADALTLAPTDVGRSLRAIAALSDLPDLEGWCADVMGAGAPARHDLRMAGKVFVVRIAPNTTRDGGVVVTLTNMTGFRALVDQAIYEREYTKAILNTVADPLVVLGADLRIQTANRAFYSMFRLSRDAAQEMSFDELGKGVFDLSLFKAQLATIAETRAFQPCEIACDLPELGLRTVTLHASPITLPGAASCLALLSFHDITERKKIEQTLQHFNETLEQRVVDRTSELTQALQRLHESEQHFRLLVDGVRNHAIAILDVDGRVTDWNPGAANLQGYSVDEIEGRHFSVFYTEDDRRAGRPAQALEAAARDGKYEIEGWSVRGNGARFWADVVIDAIRDQAGKLKGFAKITRDLTEHRAIEEQLRQAQKMEAVGLLTGGIAHDFNNMLGTILPSLELARPHIPDPVALKYIDWAARAAERGAQLTHRLLLFAHKEDMVESTFDVNRVIVELNEVLLPRTLGANVSIELRLSRDPAFVMTDPGQLESALLNLAINARDAMTLGGTLTISTARADPEEIRRADLAEGDYIVIEVADTGTGMNEATRNRVFEPFFTTRAKGKGTGLGLSMVYGFARHSGGNVTIDSALGRGTRARMYLPVAPAPVAVAEDVADCKVDAGPPSRVLVVDDDDGVRGVTVAMLLGLGHEAIEATGGHAALALLEQDKQFDAMIVDLIMPDIHGAVFAVRVRKILPDIPILFVTGFAGDHWLDDPSSTDVLKKPFRRGELAERLCRALGQPISQQLKPT